MGQAPTLRAVVCDDDPVLRDVIASLLADNGFRVVGQAASPADAYELVVGGHADVLILDLALLSGHGETVLQQLREAEAQVRVAVFSAFVENPDTLRAAGADAVFEKPSFEELEQWLVSLRSQPERPPSPAVERRRPPQPAPPLPDRGPLSPSGMEPWPTLVAALDRLWPGDAILALDVLEHETVARRGDPVVLQDYRNTLARLISPTLRPLDRLGAAPSGVIIVLLVAGHPEAAPAVFDRLELAWDSAGLRGVPVGAFARVQPDLAPSATLARLLHAVHDEGTSAEHPLRLA